MKKVISKEKKNRGATLLLVLIAMAFVGILATMVLTMAMSNLQMKKVDKESKKNFYSAEVALDEVRTGLEGEIAKEVESTYAEILLKYASLPVGEKSLQFKKVLGYRLSKKYDASNVVKEDNWTNITTTYKLDVIRNFLVDTREQTTVTAKDGLNNLECLFDNTDTKKQYICFRNICLGYMDRETKMYTQITTDIKVAIPNANFESIAERPAYTEYAVIANYQLLAENGESGSVQGNVYAGKYGGILATTGATLKFNSNQIIVSDSIATKEGGNITIDDLHPMDGIIQSDIWTKNIVTMSASSTNAIESNMNLTGKMYVSDDVTINAPNSNIKLTGSYYGYGYHNTPEDSSAMIVNRRKSLLDLTDLDNVFIAGRAYIEPVETKLENVNENSESVLTGEAISTKGNQLAYLLPGDCIGVQSDGKSVGHNPLSLAEYQALKDAMANDSSIVEVNSDYILDFNGKKLSDFVDPVKPFIRIFDKSNTSTLVYYYPNFKSEIKANDYFKDYISDKDSMDTLLKRLADNESLIYLPKNIVDNSSFGRKTYAGNIVAYTGGSSSKFYMYENSVDAELPRQFQRESEDLKKMYEAYQQKLVPSVTLYTSEEIKDNIFDSLIVEKSEDPTCPGIYELISGKTMGANNSYLFEDSSYAAYGKFMLVTNSRTTAADVFDSTNAFKVDSTVSADVHIIVATGDVEVKSNFNGIIISKGIIKLSNGAKITNSAQQVFDLICYSPVRTVFRDYNSFPIYLTNEEDKQINISSLITEENWSKN